MGSSQNRAAGYFAKPDRLRNGALSSTSGMVQEVSSRRPAQKAFEHSFYPDTISTDLHRYSVDGPVYDMPTTLSKFLCLGMFAREVILKSTWTPAKTIGREAEIGTLQAGAAADVFVFQLATGEFQYFDTHFRSRRGDKRLVPSLTIMGGKVIVPGAYEVNPRPLEPWDAEIVKLLEETA